MSRAVYASLLAAALVAGAGQISAQQREHHDDEGQVFVPGSSQEGDDDNGQRAHTNHVLHIRPNAVGAAPAGETPESIRKAYGLPSLVLSNAPYFGSRTIAIVDAYHYPNAAADLDNFSAQFGLPGICPNSRLGKCISFSVQYAKGVKPIEDCGWAQEAALDIEWAHAMAPYADIVLVEAASSSYADMFQAVTYAANLPGVSQVSLSWGGSEFSAERNYDSKLVKSGVVFFASAGDAGGRTSYPGVSPNVVSAGGTRITRNSAGVVTETAWSGGGGGRSAYEPRPTFQSVISNIVGTRRGSPDMSFDADPVSGVSVYDSYMCQGNGGWMVFGGTSVSAPALAGVVNAAGSGQTDSQSQNQMIYGGLGNGSLFRDVVSGTAGRNRAATGWDYITGVGSPLGLSGK